MLVDRLSSSMTLVWLIYFLFAELVSWMPSQASSCILVSEEANSKDYSGDYACATMHEAIFRFARYVWDNASHDNVIAFGTILIALFTFVLYRSTNKLWEAGERQLKHLESTAERQLRAYVLVKNITVSGVEDGGTPKAAVIIENSGQTPAHRLTNWVAMGLVDYPPTSHPQDTGESATESVTILGPRGQYRLLCTLNGILSLAQVEGIHNGTKAIHIVGGMTYRDALGIERHTTYNCFYGGEFGVNEEGSPFHAPNGNEAD